MFDRYGYVLSRPCCGHACLGMPNVLNKAPISGLVKLFCSFATCSCTSMAMAMLPWSFSWYGLACPQFSKITDQQYLWEGLNDFFCFLHVVVYQLLDICWNHKNMLFWVAIVMQGLSANQIARYFKLKKLELCKVSRWIFDVVR